MGFEPGLVECILDDVGDEPGNLPLLEFALQQLWEDQRSNLLTHTAYDAIGQVQGALARYADEVYEGLTGPEQELARRVFIQMVRPGHHTGDTRRLALRSELGEAAWTLVQALADKRLLVTERDASGREAAEVVHEALIHAWDRLRGWMDSDRAFRAWQERLRAALRQWEAADRDEGALLRGVPLAEAQGWLRDREADLSPEEQAFVQASLAFQKQQEAEREWRRRRTVAGLATGLLVAITLAVLTGLSWLESRRNERAALEAYSVSLAAHAQAALDDLDPATALALALAANDLDDPPAISQRVLLEAAYAPNARARYDLAQAVGQPSAYVWSMAIGPDGRTALAGLQDGLVVLFDLHTGEILHILRGHGAAIRTDEETRGHSDLAVTVVAFSPSGEMAVSGSTDKNVILWDVASGNEIRRFTGHTGWVQSVAFSPDGRRVLSGGLSGAFVEGPGELILWGVETGQEIQRFEGHPSGVVDAAFSADGRTVLASSGVQEFLEAEVENSLRLWDVETGQVVRELPLAASGGLAGDARRVAISPDGAMALTTSSDHNVYYWDLHTGELVRTLAGHDDIVSGAALTPDGRQALTASLKTLILWDLGTGSPLVSFKAHERFVNSVAISPDGRRALSGSEDGTVVVWDLSDASEIRRFQGHAAPVWDVAFTPDGKRFLSASGRVEPAVPIAEDNTIRVWDVQTGEPLRTLKGHTDAVQSVAVSPDGQQALSGSMDKTVRLWDLNSGAELRRFEGHTNWVPEVAITPDGKFAVSGSVDGDLIVWEIETGAVVHRLAVLDVWALAISPDGRLALSGGNDTVAILWDLVEGQEVKRFDSGGGGGLAFGPGGRTVVAGAYSTDLIEWNVETGQEVRRLGGHTAIRLRVSISPDGVRALSSDISGSLIWWDWPRGLPLRKVKPLDPGFTLENTLSPDGRTALATLNNGIVYWDLRIPPLNELREWIAQNRYVRPLSCEERRLYQIEPLCAAAATE